MAKGGEGTTLWFQREVTLSPKRRGCHYISEELMKACKSEFSQIKVGVAHIHIKHTSASIILNEKFDASAYDMVMPEHPAPFNLTENRKLNISELLLEQDMEMVLNKLAPENLNYKHDLEGPDDMPAHAKAALMGSSVSVPLTDGKFNLGTWQGVWLCEHRDHGGSRRFVVTVNGLKK